MKVTCALADVGTERVLGSLSGRPDSEVVLRYGAGCRATVLLRTAGVLETLDASQAHILGADGAEVGGQALVCVSRLATIPGESFVEGGRRFQSFGVLGAAVRCYGKADSISPWRIASLPRTAGAQWVLELDTDGNLSWLRDSKSQLGDLASVSRPAVDGVWRSSLWLDDRALRFSTPERIGEMPFGASAETSGQAEVVVKFVPGYVPRVDEVSRDVVRYDNVADRPDGVPDRSFFADIVGPVRSLTIVSKDGAQHWDSIVSNRATPSFSARRFTDARQTQGMRIRDRVTEQWVTLPLADGEHLLEIFVADPTNHGLAPVASPSASPGVPDVVIERNEPKFVESAFFGAGAELRLVVERPDASVVVVGGSGS